MWEPTTPSPRASAMVANSPSRSSSVSAAGASSAGASSGAASVVVPSADDNRTTSPALGDVLVLDALLQQDDALEQRLGPGWAAGDVDVHRDDLVDPLGDRVGV